MGCLRLTAAVAVSWIFTPMIFADKPYITRLMAYVLFFVGSYIAFSLLNIFIDRIFKLPILNTANKLLGFVFGCF